jgi:hypothetical protein
MGALILAGKKFRVFGKGLGIGREMGEFNHEGTKARREEKRVATDEIGMAGGWKNFLIGLSSVFICGN